MEESINKGMPKEQPKADRGAWPEWMDLKTLSRYACSGERTLREWIHRHTDPLPASQAGGKIRVSRQAFDSWMERQSVKIGRVDVDRIVNDIFSSVGER